ncbi:MAG: toxin-antitoxin system HicB family antitoxin [Prevotella sp.]|nr:toxin-antitoxin system HicB family antitoxin [Prevotella sp.]
MDYLEYDGVEPYKPYSGRLNLRVTSELHSRIAVFAAATGTTINDFINRAVQNELAHSYESSSVLASEPLLPLEKD